MRGTTWFRTDDFRELGFRTDDFRELGLPKVWPDRSVHAASVHASVHDAEGFSGRYSLENDRKLPHWLAPPHLQTRPDILHIPTLRPQDIPSQHACQAEDLPRRGHTIHIIEVGYTYDGNIHDKILEK